MPNIIAEIARFLSARELSELLQTCAPIRNMAPAQIWRDLYCARFPSRRKCPCASHACHNPRCPLCITCERAPTDMEFALLLEDRENQMPFAHARCFSLPDILRGGLTDVPSAISRGLHYQWDGDIRADLLRVPLLRGDIIMIPLSRTIYIWDGHYVVRARDNTLPATFLIPMEFKPSYFAIFNHEIQFAFDVMGVLDKIDSAMQYGCIFECGFVMSVGDAVYVVELHTTHKHIAKRIQRATVCRAQLAQDDNFRIIVDLDTALC